MLSLLVWNNQVILRNTYSERLVENADNISEQFAATAAAYVFEVDIAGLAEYARQVKTHDEILYIAVEDYRRRRVIKLGPAPSQDGFTADRNIASVDDGVFDLEKNLQISGQALGRVQVGFSLKLMEDALAEARLQGVLVASAEILLTILVGLLVSSRLTQNLRNLADATRRYGAGDRDVQVPVVANDEVSQAAASFNRMVAERKKADEVLRQSEQQFRAIIEHSHDLILVIQRDGMVRFASPSITRLLGCPPEKAIGQNALTVVDASDKDSVKAALDRVASNSGRSYTADFRVRHADGSICHFEAVAQSYVDDPAVEGIVVSCRDITERHNFEAQLRQSQKMEAIGNLTGGVAHDFNNLLAVILGNLELLEETSESPHDDEMLHDAINATHRGADLTKKLLSFARRAHLEPEHLDADEVIKDVERMLRRILPARIRLETVLMGGLWTFVAGRTLLENSILNLAINSRDAMPENGGLTIEAANVRLEDAYVEERHEDIEPGRYVMIAVSDTGSGMSREDIERAFEPFFTTKSVGEGSGLGLSMVHGFVKQSAGAVRIYSEPGFGTTVKLYFPAKSPSNSTTGATELEPRSTTETAPATPSLAKLLVVEDEAGVRKVIVRWLRTHGYEVTEASDGDAALAMLGHGYKPDLLISDIVMPGTLQGPAFAKLARTLLPDIKVILISGYPNEAAINGNNIRPDEVRLIKPVSGVDLLKTVAKLLQRG